jgi:hypothetical protein
MNRTVKEWAEFLNTDENQKFAIEIEGGLKVRPWNYKSFKDFLEVCEGWLDSPVVDVWVNNYPNGHLLIISLG